MRAPIVLAALLGIAACTAKAPSEGAAGCAEEARSVVAFTATELGDTIEARAFGPDCAKAVVVLTLRNRDGAPLWTHAASYETMGGTGGDGPAIHAFLERWAAATVDDTSASPEWPVDQPAPPGWGPSGASLFSRETYETIRAARHPRLCIPTSATGMSCLFYEPLSETVDVHFKGGRLMADLKQLAPILLTIVLAGAGGFVAGRARTGLEARVAASSAIKAGADGCGKFGSKEIDFTGRRDLAEVRIEGPDCGKALVLWTVRNADKELVLSGAEPYGAWDMTLERGKPPETGKPDMVVNAFLAQMEVRNSDWLPEWPKNQAALHGPDDPGYASTPLSRDDYEKLRAAKRPILCYGVAHEAGACAAWDKDNAGAFVVFENGV